MASQVSGLELLNEKKSSGLHDMPINNQYFFTIYMGQAKFS
jgi:hypothetical protein